MLVVFFQVCRWVLKYKTSKNPLIQMTILNLLPRLAAFQPHTFTGTSMDTWEMISKKSPLSCMFDWLTVSQNIIKKNSVKGVNNLLPDWLLDVQTSICQTPWGTCWAA